MFPLPLLSFQRATEVVAGIVAAVFAHNVAASAASSHNAREAPRLAGVHALAVIVEPTQMELAGILIVGKVLLTVVAVELVEMAAAQPLVLV